jgi:enoyl-CoA hydratase/carnithine racemase
MSEVVLYETRGPAAWVTLNRPEKLNALTKEMVAGLHMAMDAALADDQVKVVVLTGAGQAFSSGFDIGQDAGLEGADAWRQVLRADVEVTMRLRTLEKPTVAAVKGWCLGGACELALACDLIVAAEDARFGEPEIRFGSGPVTLLMPFALGEKKTNELLLTGDSIAADQAEQLGLVNRVVVAEELEATVAELVRKIAPTPLPILKLTKLALVRAAEAKGLREAVSANLDLSAILNATDTPEGREFTRIAKEQGLKAALAWRDARYGDER